MTKMLALWKFRFHLVPMCEYLFLDRALIETATIPQWLVKISECSLPKSTGRIEWLKMTVALWLDPGLGVTTGGFLNPSSPFCSSKIEMHLATVPRQFVNLEVVVGILG